MFAIFSDRVGYILGLCIYIEFNLTIVKFAPLY